MRYYDRVKVLIQGVSALLISKMLALVRVSASDNRCGRFGFSPGGHSGTEPFIPDRGRPPVLDCLSARQILDNCSCPSEAKLLPAV